MLYTKVLEILGIITKPISLIYNNYGIYEDSEYKDIIQIISMELKKSLDILSMLSIQMNTDPMNIYQLKVNMDIASTYVEKLKEDVENDNIMSIFEQRDIVTIYHSIKQMVILINDIMEEIGHIEVEKIYDNLTEEEKEDLNNVLIILGLEHEDFSQMLFHQLIQNYSYNVNHTYIVTNNKYKYVLADENDVTHTYEGHIQYHPKTNMFVGNYIEDGVIYNWSVNCRDKELRFI